MKIRLADKNDIAAIKNLLDRNFDEVMSKAHSEEILGKFKAHNSCESLESQLHWKKIYVAQEGDQIIGTGAFVNFGTADKPKYSVSNLYVLPEWHGKGAGRLIFDQLLHDAKSAKALTLHVPSSLNAVTFYEKMGFAVDEIQDELADEITWMTRKL